MYLEAEESFHGEAEGQKKKKKNQSLIGPIDHATQPDDTVKMNAGAVVQKRVRYVTLLTFFK